MVEFGPCESTIVVCMSATITVIGLPTVPHTAAKLFEDAVECYSEAIDLNPTVAVYYGNRSFANLKMENYGYALADASRALELDKTYIKVLGKAGYEVRRGAF